MNDFVLDKRSHRHCPECKGINFELIITPLHERGHFQYSCLDCGHKIEAKRQEDKQAAAAFNQ